MLNSVLKRALLSAINNNISGARQYGVDANTSQLVKNCTHLIDASNKHVADLMSKYMIIQEDFISEQEEQSLLSEIEPYMKKLRYEFDHWDDRNIKRLFKYLKAIHGFRETERLTWTDENRKILERVKKLAFDAFVNRSDDKSNLLAHVHILDLHENGYIKPHVDAIRFCGNTIAGISLLSDSVMKLTHEKDKVNDYAYAWLKRRSLYIMRDAVRYDYAHEILKQSESVFKQKEIKKTRRLSVICRNEPDEVNKNSG